MAKHRRKGLDGRQQDESGQIRHKRRDTHIGTLRETYGEGFAKGYRPNTTLGTVLAKEKVETLHQLIKKLR